MLPFLTAIMGLVVVIVGNELFSPTWVVVFRINFLDLQGTNSVVNGIRGVFEL